MPSRELQFQEKERKYFIGLKRILFNRHKFNKLS